MTYSDYIIYVDESGDHSLKKINPNYPIFVLDLCVFEINHYINEVVPRVQMLKFKYFGHDNVILHEMDIRKQSHPFGILTDANVRESFMDDIDAIIRESEFTIIATTLEKYAMTKVEVPTNPYEVAFAVCLDGAKQFLKSKSQEGRTTHVIVEKRGKSEDQDLEVAFMMFNKADALFDISFADKKTNSTGMQLADLTARPIGRHYIDPSQPNRAYDSIKAKILKW